MLGKLVSPYSPYKKKAAIVAYTWTVLIFVLCLMPAREIPDVDVPMIDKWAHILMFAGFSLLWLFAFPHLNWNFWVSLFLASVLVGCITETLQGAFPDLGRNKDVMDVVADSLGSLFGILAFAGLSKIYNKTPKG